MGAKERKGKVALLISSIEKELMVQLDELYNMVERSYVFVPDPPTLLFDDKTQNINVRTLPWGRAGKAAVVETMEAAETLAPDMLDLWPDKLYVMVFASRAPDDGTLGQRINHVLEVATYRPSSNMPRLPLFAVATLDWGDWVK